MTTAESNSTRVNVTSNSAELFDRELREATYVGTLTGVVSGGAIGTGITLMVKNAQQKENQSATTAEVKQNPPTAENAQITECVPGALFGATLGAIALVTYFRGRAYKTFG